ncbi:MAG: aminoacyl-tRNA hydrolase [Bacteroidetes bacterium]|nr:MAG: aminoacyl-tRNA hydrolase [Bacteroidota bacterium]RLD95609.1 MAG: aminoacyl-tRNA hydrolase [Bacteroidota bacterium]
MRECLHREVEFRTSRSSGPGGQHVNKTESRVELLWSPQESNCLTEEQKMLVASRLGSRITDEGVLILASEKYRSQHRNKADVTERFFDLVTSSLVPVKKRRPTRPTRSSVEKRIRSKKIRGDIKRSRRKGPEE